MNAVVITVTSAPKCSYLLLLAEAFLFSIINLPYNMESKCKAPNSLHFFVSLSFWLAAILLVVF